MPQGVRHGSQGSVVHPVQVEESLQPLRGLIVQVAQATAVYNGVGVSPFTAVAACCANSATSGCECKPPPPAPSTTTTTSAASQQQPSAPATAVGLMRAWRTSCALGVNGLVRAISARRHIMRVCACASERMRAHALCTYYNKRDIF